MADETSLTQDFLSKLQVSFDADPKNALLQNYSVKNGIKEACLSAVECNKKVHLYNCTLSSKSSPVTNQQGSGRCWIFAMLNVARLPIIKKYGLEGFEFSQTYLHFWDKVERANYLLETFIKTKGEPLEGRLMMWLLANPYEDGGQWDMLLNLLNKYGLVPKSVFPETWNSEHTRSFNAIITNKMRGYALRLRQLAEEGKSDDELRKEKEWMLEEHYRLCCLSYGCPPSQFEWEYKEKSGNYCCVKELTPVKFYETIVKPLINLEDKVCLIHDPRPNHEFGKLYTVQYLGNVVGGYPVRYINTDIDEMKICAIKSLKNDEAVWFGCDVDKHSDAKMGLLDLNIYNHRLAFGVSDKEMNKAQRLQYGETCMTHAMVFHGVHLEDPSSLSPVPVRWCVENSWGSNSGKAGYLLMTDKWFSEFVFEVVVDKKFVRSELLEALKEPAVALPPWDPMGALASTDDN